MRPQRYVYAFFIQPYGLGLTPIHARTAVHQSCGLKRVRTLPAVKLLISCPECCTKKTKCVRVFIENCTYFLLKVSTYYHQLLINKDLGKVLCILLLKIKLKSNRFRFRKASYKRCKNNIQMHVFPKLSFFQIWLYACEVHTVEVLSISPPESVSHCRWNVTLSNSTSTKQCNTFSNVCTT